MVAMLLVRRYVRWLMVPGYVVVVSGMTILGMLDGTEDLSAFLVVTVAFGLALAAGAILLVRGTNDPRGFKAWLSRIFGWLMLAAITIPFISGLFVLGPLLLLALPVWVPLRSAD